MTSERRQRLEHDARDGLCLAMLDVSQAAVKLSAMSCVLDNAGCDAAGALGELASAEAFLRMATKNANYAIERLRRIAKGSARC